MLCQPGVGALSRRLGRRKPCRGARRQRDANRLAHSGARSIPSATALAMKAWAASVPSSLAHESTHAS